MSSTRRATLVMAFTFDAELPKAGETRIMSGGYGIDYAVTVHRVKSVERGEKYVYVEVIATKRALTAEREPTPAAENVERKEASE